MLESTGESSCAMRHLVINTEIYSMSIVKQEDDVQKHTYNCQALVQVQVQAPVPTDPQVI